MKLLCWYCTLMSLFGWLFSLGYGVLLVWVVPGFVHEYACWVCYLGSYVGFITNDTGGASYVRVLMVVASMDYIRVYFTVTCSGLRVMGLCVAVWVFSMGVGVLVWGGSY